MSTDLTPTVEPDTQPPAHPFRRAVLRGLAVVLPPLLTIVIFLWIFGTIRDYVLLPVEAAAANAIVWMTADVRQDIPGADPAAPHVFVEGRPFVRLKSNQYVPLEVYDLVRKNLHRQPMPEDARAVYQLYVRERYLKWYIVVPLFVSLFVLILYFVGKFLAAGIGRMLLDLVEGIVHRLPIVRTVYSSVKQVTDMVFSERQLHFLRVVAVEYPRKGMWSLAFVTGESMADIQAAANESVVSVLVPTSPMPATGFTVTVRRSETIDLNITIDQALQFIVSCGVVVPSHQQPGEVGRKITSAIAAHQGIQQNGGKDGNAAAGEARRGERPAPTESGPPRQA